MTHSAAHDPNDSTTVTSLRQLLTQREGQLAQTQQEIAGLLYAISHDLRAPLRALSGFSQALQEHLSSNADETAVHYLQRLEQSSQRLMSMIDALLSLSKIAQSDVFPIDCDLATLASESIADIEKRFPTHQPVINISGPLPVHGDARLLKQLLTKLLENAWKCTLKSSEPQIEVGSIEEAEHTIYFVRDNGVGFDMSLANKLFIPFQQLHGDEYLRGQGLGLAMAQRIIALHGGRIWAQSEPRHGAQFFFSISS